MEMSLFTDYALRTLIYAGLVEHDRLASVRSIANAYGLSQHHLVKVVHRLSKLLTAARRDTRLVVMTGRLAAGVSVDQAAAEFRVLAETLETEHPNTNRGRQVQLLSARRAIGGR